MCHVCIYNHIYLKNSLAIKPKLSLHAMDHSSCALNNMHSSQMLICVSTQWLLFEIGLNHPPLPNLQHVCFSWPSQQPRFFCAPSWVGEASKLGSPNLIPSFGSRLTSLIIIFSLLVYLLIPCLHDNSLDLYKEK